MEPRNSLLVGQIALDLQFITRQQLDECLVLQAGQVKSRSIGALLVENGFLTEEHLAKVMEEQKRRLQQGTVYSEGQKDEVSFGRLLVKAGYAKVEQVNEALRAQQDLAERGRRKRVGELLVEAGHIAPEAVLAVLKMQGKVLMACTFCGAHFNVLSSITERYPCRRCGMALGDQVVGVSAEESAYLLPAINTAVAPPGTNGASGKAGLPSRPEAPPQAADAPSRPASATFRRTASLVLLAGLILLLLFLLSR
jgi:hypothetical protein